MKFNLVRQILVMIIGKNKLNSLFASEAVILKLSQISKNESKGTEVKILLQINPPKSRSFLYEHTGFFSEEELSTFLHQGQKIRFSSRINGKEHTHIELKNIDKN